MALSLSNSHSDCGRLPGKGSSWLLSSAKSSKEPCRSSHTRQGTATFPPSGHTVSPAGVPCGAESVARGKHLASWSPAELMELPIGRGSTSSLP